MDEVLRRLDARSTGYVRSASQLNGLRGLMSCREWSERKRSHDEVFSRGDILRRMEEDRERVSPRSPTLSPSPYQTSITEIMLIRAQHKRLRERIWILPIPPLHHPSSLGKPIGPSPSSGSPFTPASPAQGQVGKMMPPPPPVPPTSNDGRGEVVEKQSSALDLEFEQLWETTSELGEDDLERMKEWVVPHSLWKMS